MHRADAGSALMPSAPNLLRPKSRSAWEILNKTASQATAKKYRAPEPFPVHVRYSCHGATGFFLSAAYSLDPRVASHPFFECGNDSSRFSSQGFLVSECSKSSTASEPLSWEILNKTAF